jgi:hypothetical protein
MSGGTFEHQEMRLSDIAFTLRRRAETPAHRALANHLYELESVLKKLDYYFAGDSSEQEPAELFTIVSPLEELDQVKIDLKDLELQFTKVHNRINNLEK